MTLEEIKSSVLSGKTVHWMNPGYQVIVDNIGQWMILFSRNDDCTGLTRKDGVMLYNPEDFYIG